MRKLHGIKILFLLTLLLSFTACEEEDTTFDRLVGRTWVGDLGFYYGGYPVESGLAFDPDGFAIDEQYYFDTGTYATNYRVRWYLDNGTLYLDYGNFQPQLEIVDIRVNGSYLTGWLYVDGHKDSYVTLRMK